MLLKLLIKEKLFYMIKYIKFFVITVFFFCSNKIKISNHLPNIVFINIDDMGWNDVSFMGSKYYMKHQILIHLPKTGWYSPKDMQLPLIVRQVEHL